MSFNFPINPSLNQTYSVGDKTWIYDGRGWKLSTLQFSVTPIYDHANGAFDKANSANSLAQAAFDAANNAGSSEEVQTIFAHANGAFDQANAANVLAQNAYDSGNTTYTYASSSYGHANGAFDQANSANILAQSAYDSGNSTFTYSSSGYDHANGAFNKANSANVLAQFAYDFANTRYSSDGGTISGDVQISGNLTVTGNTYSLEIQSYVVDDPIIYLAANNYTSDLTDIGFVGNYHDNGTDRHFGLVRKFGTNDVYLFTGYDEEFDNNLLNIANPNLVYANLHANLFGNANTATDADTLDGLHGTSYANTNFAESSYTHANAAFNQANSDVTSISTTAGVYGNNTIVPVITLEANGRISSITNVAISGIGGSTSWIKKIANYTASVGERIIADTTTGSFTITLPPTPELGDSVTVADGNNWYTNNLTVARNGSTIENTAEDLILDIEGVQIEFVYDGNTWEVYAFTGPSAYPNPSGNTGKFLTTDGNSSVWSTITETYVTSSFTHANSAFNKANSANILAQSAYTHANSSFTHANGAFNKANSANVIAQSAYNTANNYSTSATPNTYAYRNATGDLYANNLYANNLVSTSDIRFKNDIQSIDNPIELLNSLNGVSFKWINTETKSYGLIAQELEKVLPELVSTTNDVKSVMYIPIIAILIEAIKQQQKEIEEIRNGKT